MQNQISLNFKISYPPQSLFLFFCTEMYIPRFDIPCVKGSLCPASFCICQSNFSCNDSYFFSQRTGISHIGFRLLSIKLKMKVVTFENALKNFLLDFVYFLLYGRRPCAGSCYCCCFVLCTCRYRHCKIILILNTRASATDRKK